MKTPRSTRPEPLPTRKPTKGQAAAKSAPRIRRVRMGDLTPERLIQLWRLDQPDRPETRSMLERIFRQSK